MNAPDNELPGGTEVRVAELQALSVERRKLIEQQAATIEELTERLECNLGNSHHPRGGGPRQASAQQE